MRNSTAQADSNRSLVEFEVHDLAGAETVANIVLHEEKRIIGKTHLGATK